MIEILVLKYLKGMLPDIEVCIMRPDKLPYEYVRIEKTGCSEEEHLMQANFAIQSCSQVSLLRAAELSQQVRWALKAMPNFENVYRVELTNEYPNTNPTTKEYIYQADFRIFFKEQR